MTKNEFLRLLEKDMDLAENTLRGDERLKADLGWDSMSVVVFLAFADEAFGKQITPEHVDAAKSVEDLMKLVGVEA